MKKLTLLKKAFFGFLCTGMAGAFSVTTWAQPTVKVPDNCIVVVTGSSGLTGTPVSLGPGGVVGNGGIVVMSDPFTPDPLVDDQFTIYDNTTTLQTWWLLGDLSFQSGSLDQSIPATTSATSIYSFNKNPRQSEQPSNLARSKGRVYISYDASPCGGRIEFDIYKKYDDSIVPSIIGPDCWLPDSVYTYSVDQIASDNLGDGIGIDMYYWKIEDNNGTLIYNSEAPPSSYPDSYTSADKSSITTKVPSSLNSPYTITCCFGRANDWDGNAGGTHTTCVSKVIGAQPIQPSVNIPSCVSVSASSFTASIVSPVAGYTYHWTTSNSAWTPVFVIGTSATFGTLGTGEGTVFLTVDAGGCSSSQFHYNIGRTLEEPITTITGATCLSAGDDYTFEVTNASQLNIDWILPSGWVIDPNPPTNGNHSVINVQVPNTATVGTYTLEAWSCDNNVLISKTVYVRPENPVISSPANASICIAQGDNTPLTFTVSPVGNYQWQIPAGWNPVGPVTSESITVTPDGITTGAVIATGVGAGGCTSLSDASWTINFDAVQPDTIDPVACWNFGYDADNVITVQNAPYPFFGTYTVTSSPTGLFSSYDFDPNTGAITLHTLGSAPAGTYILTITHSTGGVCLPQSNTNIPIDFGGNGAVFSNYFSTGNCDYYFGPSNTTTWLVDGQPVTSNGTTVTIVGGNTLILCGTNTPPTSVCAEVTTGGCTTRVCSDTLGTHSAIMINGGSDSFIKNGSSRDLIEVYPNPTKGTFSVKLAQIEKTADLQVFDMQGRLINKHTLGSGENTITENVSNGTYLLLINVDGEISAHKIEVNSGK